MGISGALIGDRSFGGPFVVFWAGRMGAGLHHVTTEAKSVVVGENATAGVMGAECFFVFVLHGLFKARSSPGDVAVRDFTTWFPRS